MSDPRITILTPKVADSPAPLTRGEVALKIIDTTKELQSVRRPLRLDGVISAVSKDGNTATIQTAKGDVTVQLRNNTPVQEGQKVEIDIPAGQPPRQTILRATPDTPQQQPQSPTPQTPQPSGTIPTTPQTQPTQSTPVQQGQNQQQGQSASSQQSQTPQSPPLPTLPSSQTSTQAALPTDIRAVLDQAAPSTTFTALPPLPTALPANAIVRLVPLPGLPAAIDLLPVPTAVQALIDSAPLNSGLLNAGTVSPGDDFAPAPLPGLNSDKGIDGLAKAPSFPGAPVTPDDLTLTTKPIPVGAGLFPKGPSPLPGTTQPPASLPDAKPLLPAPLPSGIFDARILSITPKDGLKITAPILTPAASGMTPVTLPDHAPLPGTIIATTKENFPILTLTTPGTKTPQIFQMQFPATNLPVGTALEIMPQQILPVPGAAPQTTMMGPAHPSELLTGWTWPVFDDTMQALTQMMPQAHMGQTLANVLPSPANPTVMNSAVMFFIAAIQSGDIASWFGDKAISALRRDAARGGDILERLTRDVDGLSRMTETPVSQDWKGLAIPLYWQTDIQKMHLFYRHQDAEKDDDDKENAGDRSTRFIFDLNLTNMGDIQLDGLMKSRSLNLILRTGTMLSHGMQTVLRQKYQNVLEAGNLTGDLTFQNRMDQWIHVRVAAKPPNWGSSI